MRWWIWVLEAVLLLAAILRWRVFRTSSARPSLILLALMTFTVFLQSNPSNAKEIPGCKMYDLKIRATIPNTFERIPTECPKVLYKLNVAPNHALTFHISESPYPHSSSDNGLSKDIDDFFVIVQYQMDQQYKGMSYKAFRINDKTNYPPSILKHGGACGVLVARVPLNYKGSEGVEWKQILACLVEMPPSGSEKWTLISASLTEMKLGHADYTPKKDFEQLARILFRSIRIKGKGTASQLHNAAGEGNLDKVRQLIADGMDINIKDGEELTPLHRSVQEGHLSVAKLLLTRGAKIEARDINGNTALHYATLRGDVDMVMLLIDKGANINARDKDLGITPLWRATGSGNTAVAELLIIKGADINSRDILGMAPLHIASANGYIALVELLIRKGAKLNAKTNDGKTPLDLAVRYGHKKVIELLGKHGSEVQQIEDEEE